MKTNNSKFCEFIGKYIADGVTTIIDSTNGNIISKNHITPIIEITNLKDNAFKIILFNDNLISYFIASYDFNNKTLTNLGSEGSGIFYYDDDKKKLIHNFISIDYKNSQLKTGTLDLELISKIGQN